MSFFASNDRIRVTNNAGGVVFDTTKPMPHIIQWLNTSAQVAFPNVACEYGSRTWAYNNAANCRYQENQYICKVQNVCKQVYKCKPVTTCAIVDGVYKCTTSQQCGYETVCGLENVCGWEWVWLFGTYVNIETWYTYAAQNWSTLVDLGPVDQGLDADFLLVNAVCTRSKQGQIIDIGGLPCGLPLGSSFSANNSSIVESASNVADGTPWLTRIMSVFVQNGRIYAEFKHTNRGFQSASKWASGWCELGTPLIYPPGMPTNPPDAGSNYSFNFEIVVGKFTI